MYLFIKKLFNGVTMCFYKCMKGLLQLLYQKYVNIQQERYADSQVVRLRIKSII